MTTAQENLCCQICKGLGICYLAILASPVILLLFVLAMALISLFNRPLLAAARACLVARHARVARLAPASRSGRLYSLRKALPYPSARHLLQ